MNKKTILNWFKYFIITTSILFVISIVLGSTSIYLNMSSDKVRAIMSFFPDHSTGSISDELVVEGVYNIGTAWYYAILNILAYSALASAVVSTILCIVKNKKNK